MTAAKVYKISFLLKDQHISQLDVTRIVGSERIIDLQHQIKDQSPELAGAHAKHLSLYIAPMPDGINDTLQDFFLQLDRNECEKLSGFLRIDDTFPEPGTGDVMVIVKPPAAVCKTFPGEPTTQDMISLPKRTITDDDIAERPAKRAPLFKMDIDIFLELYRRVMSSPWCLVDYCNPQRLLKLPFPFLEERPTSRFKFEGDHFIYYGRERFENLYKIARDMNFKGTRLYFVHGTMGAGKSHMLAALACALTKIGRRVVYLPDCRGLLRTPFTYLKSALQLTFATDEYCRWCLDRARTLADLEDFCHQAAPKLRLLFIIDQADALDHQENQTSDRGDNEKKAQIRNLLDSISGVHLKLASSSASYQGGLGDAMRQMQEERMMVYDGLSSAEMCQWWAMHAREKALPMDFTEEEKQTVQDLTGQMPILLTALTKISMGADETFTTFLDKLWMSPEVSRAGKQISKFNKDQCAKLLGTPLSVDYQRCVLACLSNGPTDAVAADYLDWRYFFVGDDDVGHTTSEVARQVAGRCIRPQVSICEFLERNWYDSISCAPNRSALGFIIELMVISWIATRGCPSAGDEFASPPRYKFISKMQPELTDDNGSTLYIPRDFNYKAVDAILVNVNQGAREAIIVGIQITIGKNNTDSETPLMRQWEAYADKLKGSGRKVTYRFLWIKEELDGELPREEQDAKVRQLKSGPITVSPAYTRLRATVRTVSPDIGEKLEGTYKREKPVHNPRDKGGNRKGRS